MIIINKKLKNVLDIIGFEEFENKWLKDTNYFYKKFRYKEYVFLITFDKEGIEKIYLKDEYKYIHSYKYNTYELFNEETINLVIKDLFIIFYKELRKDKIKNFLNNIE